MINKEIKSYKDLEVWKRSHQPELAKDLSREYEELILMLSSIINKLKMTPSLITNYFAQANCNRARRGQHFSLNTLVKRGFTIIELLVVIGIISILGTITADIFLSVTRSYNKASVIAAIEQSGNIALSQMTTEIRNARSVSPASGTTSTLTIINADSVQVVFSFVPSTSTTNGYVSRNGIPITDNAFTTGVNAAALSFTIVDSQPPSVTIALTLTQPVGTPSRVDFQASTTLRTSVSLRTY